MLQSHYIIVTAVVVNVERMVILLLLKYNNLLCLRNNEHLQFKEVQLCMLTIRTRFCGGIVVEPNSIIYYIVKQPAWLRSGSGLSSCAALISVWIHLYK